MTFRSPFSFLAPVPSGWGDPRAYRNGVHEGVDLAVPVGTPVLAIASGIVETAVAEPCNSAGLHVSVAHDGGEWRSTVMHLSRVDVRRGQRVRAAERLGLSGRTGGSARGPGCTFDEGTRDHVHLTVRRAAAKAGKHRGSEVRGFVAVPAEPLIPAKYEPRVVAALAKIGLTPARAAVAGGGALALAAVAWLGWRWWRRRGGLSASLAPAPKFQYGLGDAEVPMVALTDEELLARSCRASGAEREAVRKEMRTRGLLPSAPKEARPAVRVWQHRTGARRGPQVSKPGQVCEFLRGMADADRESFVALHLDARHRVVGVEEIARGHLTGVDVHPRETFKGAILGNAAALIVAHNHPSGAPEPSPEDLMLTRRLVEAGKLLNIPVLDHVVVGSEGCVSLRDRGVADFGGLGARPRRRR